MNLEQNLCKYKHQIFLFLAGNHKFLQIPGLWNVFSINTKFSEIWFCLRSFCYRLLDLFPHSNGRYPREDGAPGHAVPGAGQHLQHSDHQHTQGGGADSYRGLDVGLYSFRFWCFNRVSIFLFWWFAIAIIALVAAHMWRSPDSHALSPVFYKIIKWIEKENLLFPFISVLRTKIPNMGHSHWTLSACPLWIFVPVLKQEAGALLLLPSIFAAS